MTSSAKVLSSLPAPRALPAPSARRALRGILRLLRDALGGAFILAAWLVLWTVTWAAVAGPLSPSSAPVRSAAVSVVARS
jgi:hypothetical protein